MKPATPLPWAWESVPHQVGKRIIAIETGDTVAAIIPNRDDAIYLANAAMAYPELVAALRECVAELEDTGTTQKARAILARLGESV